MLNNPKNWLRALAVGAVLAAAPAAHAFGLADAGVYAVFDPAGKQTEVTYRFYQVKGKWVAEERAADGSWTPFICKGDCEILPLSPVDTARVFGKMLDLVEFACLGNVNFALCTFTTKKEPKKSGYMMAVHSPKGPMMVHIARIEKLQ
jgi:hypothetical protein